MKRYGICLVAGLLLVPGCKKPPKADSVDSTNKSAAYKKAGQASVFDESVEEFVLEEKNNPFAAPNEGEVTLVDTEDGWNPDSRQSQYETIYFEFDKYDIRQDQVNALGRNADNMKSAAKKGATIVAEGHACTSGGSASYNMALSEKRARAAKKQLVKQGVPANSIKTVGRGSEMCKVIGGNQEQQAPNRRVEFYTMENDKNKE